MNNFAYRVYYKYAGPTASAPLRSPKTQDEISDALRWAPDDLRHYLSDQNAVVASEDSNRTDSTIVLRISTTMAEADVDAAVARCLTGLDLFGDRLPSSK